MDVGRDYFNTIAISIFRPLQRLPVIPLNKGLGTAKDLCTEHSKEMISYITSYRSTFSFKHSFAPHATPYVAAFTLFAQLDGSTLTAELFTRACQYLREWASKLDILRYALRALEALALLHQVPIPQAALPYFWDLGLDNVSLDNVPINSLTAELPLSELPGAQGNFKEQDSTKVVKFQAETMRDLLAKWTSLTMNDQSSIMRPAPSPP